MIPKREKLEQLGMRKIQKAEIIGIIFAPDGKTPLNDAGRIINKTTTAAHIPSK